ncbi:MAG: hypothetical protein WBH20_08200 [Oceanisphaera sp.]|uniref:hypothetical protein n=1 Tax=Oceanisphaera sp. TaxID=1929979 RepID=UPI003C788889
MNNYTENTKQQSPLQNALTVDDYAHYAKNTYQPENKRHATDNTTLTTQSNNNHH